MSNSNFNITKVTVDPVSQEISSLEINGKPIETGSEPNLQEGTVDISNNGYTTLTPNEGYDGFSSVEINTEVQLPTPLFITTLYECGQDGSDIEDPETIEVYAFYAQDFEFADFIDAMYLKTSETVLSLVTYNKIRIENPGYRPDHFYIYQYNNKYYRT